MAISRYNGLLYQSIAKRKSNSCITKTFSGDHPVFCSDYNGALYQIAQFDARYTKGVDFENSYKVGDSVMVYFMRNKPL